MGKKIKPVIVPAPARRNMVNLDLIKSSRKSGAHIDKKKEVNKKESRNFKYDKDS